MPRTNKETAQQPTQDEQSKREIDRGSRNPCDNSIFPPIRMEHNAITTTSTPYEAHKEDGGEYPPKGEVLPSLQKGCHVDAHQKTCLSPNVMQPPQRANTISIPISMSFVRPYVGLLVNHYLNV
ncbi:unnamed protein product [Arabis nemorensis]|uniref:Uncharacterized protein n=1 Tax=Arabis nemorensis TaxID=586526 RepID=A0A565AYU9_9BRAS|nr:unnamed protein product [Arabis nemorensis]